MTQLETQSHKPPAVSTTGDGYQYVRCRANGDDSTAYVHQLCAIAAGEEPERVFGRDLEVHHKLRVPTDWDAPQIDVPWNVELVPGGAHGASHMNGWHDDLEADVPLEVVADD